MRSESAAPRRLALVAGHALRGPESLPLGAACVAAAVAADPGLAGRVEIRLFETWPEDGGAAVAAELAAWRPDAVGFSVYVWNRPRLAEAARRLRRSLPEALLFAGGPEAGADPDRLIADFGLDFAVAGEGEAAAPAALGAWMAGESGGWSAIAGIRLPGQAGLPLVRAPAPNPAGLPSPWLDGAASPSPEGGALWELARGCPFACSFCYESRGERTVRPFPRARIERELERFRRLGVRHAFVLDPTFNANRARALELLRLFAERGGGIHFNIEVRAEFLDEAQARAFAGLDCSVQIGLQSAHPAVLARLNRSLDRKDFERKADLLNRHGVVFGLDLIYGLPGDSLDGFRRSLDWALGRQPNHLDVFPLAVLPGTALADDADGLGLDRDPAPPYLARSAPGFGAADLAAAAGLARDCDLFYNHGRAVPWFGAVRAALRLGASELLEGFAAGAPAEPPPQAAVEARQLAWLEARFRAAGRPALWPAAADLVRLHGAISRAFAEGAETVLDLRYPSQALDGPAALDLERFAATVPAAPNRVRVRLRNGGVRVDRVR